MVHTGYAQLPEQDRGQVWEGQIWESTAFKAKYSRASTSCSRTHRLGIPRRASDPSVLGKNFFQCNYPPFRGHLPREFQKNIYFCLIDYAKAFDCVDHNKLWKILKEMGIPDHLTCLLRSLYAGQEATVSTVHGITDWFQIGKGVRQGCILSPCLFNLYLEDIMRIAGRSTSWN